VILIKGILIKRRNIQEKISLITKIYSSHFFYEILVGASWRKCL